MYKRQDIPSCCCINSRSIIKKKKVHTHPFAHTSKYNTTPRSTTPGPVVVIPLREGQTEHLSLLISSVRVFYTSHLGASTHSVRLRTPSIPEALVYTGIILRARGRSTINYLASLADVPRNQTQSFRVQGTAYYSCRTDMLCRGMI